MKQFLLAQLLLVTCLMSAGAFAGPVEEAQFIYTRLTGKNLNSSTSVSDKMISMITAGDKLGAAALAAEDPAFISAKVRYWAAMIISRDAEPSLLLNDSMALLIGSVRDNLDAREILTGNYIYGRTPKLGAGRPAINSNVVFGEMDAVSRELSTILYPYTPQWEGNISKETSGILTTRYWASLYYDNAATNRLAFKGVMWSFMCKEEAGWKRPNLPTDRIRQDINRLPNGNAATFQNDCRWCHAPMDGMAGAFAKMNFVNGQIQWSSTVLPKYTQHSDIYPDGYVTTDDSWVNYLEDNMGSTFGWSGAMEGKGVKEFGTMIANSRLFSECMTKRTFSTVCKQDLNLKDDAVKAVAENFRKNGYKLRDLFLATVTNEKCKK